MYMRVTKGRVKSGCWETYEAAYVEHVEGKPAPPGLLGAAQASRCEPLPELRRQRLVLVCIALERLAGRVSPAPQSRRLRHSGLTQHHYVSDH